MTTVHDALFPDPFEMDDLDRVLDPEVPVEIPEPLVRFEVTDTGKAEWAMGKHNESVAFIADRTAEAEAMHARVDEWLAAEIRPHERRRDFMAEHLRRYALRIREESGGRTKLVRLLSGIVQTRKSTTKAKVVITDEELVLKWLDEHVDPGVVGTIVKRSVGLTKLRELLTVVTVPVDPDDPEAGQEYRVVSVGGETGIVGVEVELPSETISADVVPAPEPVQ